MLQRVHSPSIETKLLKSSKPLEPKRESFGNGRDIVGTYAPKDGAGAYGTWNINVTGRATSAGAADSAAMATRAASADRAAMADKATMADKAGWANEANLALNIPTYDRGGNIWIA